VAKRRETVAERRGGVVSGHDDSGFGSGCEWRRQIVAEDFADGVEGELGRAIAAREAECPVCDLGAAGVTFVGEGEHYEAGEAELERGAALPRKEIGLMLFALANRIH